MLRLAQVYFPTPVKTFSVHWRGWGGSRSRGRGRRNRSGERSEGKRKDEKSGREFEAKHDEVRRVLKEGMRVSERSYLYKEGNGSVHEAM